VEPIGVGLQAERQDFLEHAKLIEHLEARRMNGRGALVLDRSGLGFEHRDGNAAPVQRQRAHHADRTRADNDDAGICFR